MQALLDALSEIFSDSTHWLDTLVIPGLVASTHVASIVVLLLGVAFGVVWIIEQTRKAKPS